ncbi:MAG: tripartite tricarboxylate transporter permease, partial [Burkholderiales bacterium]|nr:tripartite tricarboxylate transporter permease [Burkholderiales bacterium]
VLLVILNVPMIGVWVKMLRVPYKYLYPAALFFICVGVYSTKSSLFDVGEVAVFGILGAVFLSLDFPVSPIVLGFVLGPMLEENFRRAMLLSGGDLSVFVTRPISAWFIGASSLLILAQLIAYARKRLRAAETMPVRELAGE